ncbi:TetR family transcriptional regulator [Phenylobacterium sp.]|uniref:TetR family transcriptional regulator n=1 Tax=Phenylobacterium sp. TaxID=1871053 RepID=UPI0027366966|nr:TetR family transcriptional regulator [Phenylobacterium sp.]MDP3855705.1 TetR family transcriptional regulator [Phenylobacterium sp.]
MPQIRKTFSDQAAAPAKSAGGTRKRGLKREALLAQATKLFNLRGIAATSLSDIAAEAGLTRAALYYYLDDRAELVFQCYMRACDQTAEDLAIASEAPGGGLGQVLAFVERATAPDRPPVAVLSEIGYLASPHRELVETANRRNAAHLEAMVEQGVRDGGIRLCDAKIAARSIIGMLSWAQLSPYWVLGAKGPGFRARTGAAMLDLLKNGIGQGARNIQPCPVDAQSFLPGRFNAFDRREAAEMKAAQLVMTASQLFNRNGIEATSLDDVSAALGATKGVVYHYMQDKTDLVVRCYERGFDLFEAFAAAAKARGATGFERSMIGVHLNTQAQVGELSPLMPQVGLDALPAPHRQAFVRRANRLRNQFSVFIRQGIADGSCRPCDVPIVAQLGAGAFGWLPKWITPDDARDPLRFGDEVVALFTLGLKAS